MFQQSSNVENLSPQILRAVLKEMTELVKSPPEGIKVTINEQDITDIQAIIAGPGLYCICICTFVYSNF